MITFKHHGNLKRTSNFLDKLREFKIYSILKKYAEDGVNALSIATPVDSGETAMSWSYEISVRGDYGIIWTNSNIVDGVPIAIILQYGHGTGNGGYVQGRDYINPAISPIIDKIIENISKEVSRL